MSAATVGAGGAEFLVRADGTVVSADDAAGTLAAALPYAGRLARRTGELLGVGDFRSLEVVGRRRLAVGVTWTPAGEGTYRALAAPLPPRTIPQFMVVGAVDTAAAVRHCLTRLATLDGLLWSAVVTADSRVVAASGEGHEELHLAEAGNRVLAVLRSLEDEHTDGFLRLRFERGALVGAALGRHALVADAPSTTDDALLAMLDEVRAILADHDLTEVPAVVDAEPEPEPEPVAAPVAPAPPPLVGARFAGAGPRPERKPRRSRLGQR
jgi:hypothetical protein